MSKFSNPWSGAPVFYRSRKKHNKYTAKTDKEYLQYCEKYQDKTKRMSYAEWCRDQRRKYGLF